MKIVVFGANGQLSRCFQGLQKRIKGRQYQFLDKSKFDISNPASYDLLDAAEIDILLNCAAYTKVDQAESDQDQAYRVNVLGTALLASYGAKFNIPLIHISTDYVYGPAEEPMDESHDLSPVNYYGMSKLLGEEAILKSEVEFLILRTSWLYSEYGHNFVKTMLRLADGRDEISVVDDQMGSPTYAADLADAVDHILHASDDINSISWGAYNFANKGAVSWYEFAREILKDKHVSVKPIPSSDFPTPAARPAYSVLDVSLFEETFNWEIPGWKDGLGRCMEKM